MAISHHRPDLAGAFAFAGPRDVAVRGDIVAVVFALSDTVYLLRFRWPGPGTQAFRAWNEGFPALSHLYWLRDGSFLVQHFDI